MDNEALDFELDRTHKTLFEAGKLKGNAFSTYLVLLATTSLLVFGHGNTDQVKVPFIELTLNKDSASAVLLALSCVALYWYNITHVKQWLLRSKMLSLYHERYGKDLTVNWHVGYPTPLWIPTSTSVAPIPPVLAVLANGIFMLLNLAGYVVPALLSWRITGAYNLSVLSRLIITSLLILPALIVQAIASFDRRMLPKTFEGYFQARLLGQRREKHEINTHEGDV